MKVMIIYDSLSGNTKDMAKVIAEGVDSVVGTVVEMKKIGESFPLSMLEKADGVIFGSPCIYADVSQGMRGFLENLKKYVKKEKNTIEGKPAAIFGSYGWDGAWVMEERLKKSVQDIGFKIKKEILVETSNNIKYNAEAHMNKWKKFGKEFAESLK